MIDLKKLAEFSAEFLIKNIPSGSCIRIDFGDMKYKEEMIHLIFHHEVVSPALAHLGKREMISRKFNFDLSFCPPHWERALNFNYHFYRGNMEPDNNWIEGSGKDENEYMALWSAIFATGEK